MKLEIEIATGEAAKAKAVLKALVSDAKPKRGSAKFSTSGDKLLMKLEANDKIAMRASVNSSLRIADACLSILR